MGWWDLRNLCKLQWKWKQWTNELEFNHLICQSKSVTVYHNIFLALSLLSEEDSIPRETFLEPWLNFLPLGWEFQSSDVGQISRASLKKICVSLQCNLHQPFSISNTTHYPQLDLESNTCCEFDQSGKNVLFDNQNHSLFSTAVISPAMK